MVGDLINHCRQGTTQMAMREAILDELLKGLQKSGFHREKRPSQ